MGSQLNDYRPWGGNDRKPDKFLYAALWCLAIVAIVVAVLVSQ